MPGEKGMDDMKELLERFRSDPPSTIAGLSVAQRRDYGDLTVTPTGGQPEPLDGPQGDLVILDLEPAGNYVAVRPSGTEPKVKFYMFAYAAPQQSADLAATRQAMDQRLTAVEDDLVAFADGI